MSDQKLFVAAVVDNQHGKRTYIFEGNTSLEAVFASIKEHEFIGEVASVSIHRNEMAERTVMDLVNDLGVGSEQSALA